MKNIVGKIKCYKYFFGNNVINNYTGVCLC